MTRKRNSTFETVIMEDPRTVLSAERLQDGRVAFSTRTLGRDGEWKAGDLNLLEPRAFLDLASWLAPAVEESWMETVRARATESLRTAEELHGAGAAGARRLAAEILEELPPGLMARALVLLANAIGPAARERLVARLNETDDLSEDARIRVRLADENAAFAYAIAAAGLFDALDRGAVDDG